MRARWTMVFALMTACASSRAPTPPPDAAMPALPDDDGGTEEDAGSPVVPDAASVAEQRVLEAAWREDPLYRSGERLRARVYEASGAPAVFRSFYDTELEVDCHLQPADDGSLRCLPVSSDHFDVVYLDEACTEPFARGRSQTSLGCDFDPPPLLADGSIAEPACTAFDMSAYRVGSRRAPTMSYVRLGDDCSPVELERCAFDVEPIEASAFVRADVDTLYRSRRLALDVVRYEDGAEVALAMRDRERDVSCAPLPWLPETCVPTEQAHSFDYMFASADCSGPRAAFDSGSACGDANIVVRWIGDCGGYTFSLNEIGPSLQRSYTLFDACSPLEGSDAVFEVGPELPPSALPALRTVHLGRLRVALSYYATEDGTPMGYAEPFFDTLGGYACAAEATSEGYACVPHGLDRNQNGPFADTLCSEPIAEHLAAYEACDVEPPLFIRVRGDEGIVSVHARGPLAELRNGLVYNASGDECLPTLIDEAYAYYTLGAALDLAPLQERLEQPLP